MKYGILPSCLRPRSRRERTSPLAVSVAAFIALSAAGARADEVATSTGGPYYTDLVYLGQSFTTITSVPETNINFTFITNIPMPGPTTGFLLSAPYSGYPDNLSSSTPGFLGEAVAPGGTLNGSPAVNPAADVFSFGASVTLQPNTQYFFYQNATSQVTAGQTYSGGNSYISFGSDQLFSSNSTSLNFSVTGSPAAPETSNLLVGLGVLGLVGFECLQRKRRKLAA